MKIVTLICKMFVVSVFVCSVSLLTVHAAEMMKELGTDGPGDTKHSGSADEVKNSQDAIAQAAFNGKNAKQHDTSELALLTEMLKRAREQKESTQKDPYLVEAVDMFQQSVNDGNFRIVPDAEMPAGERIHYRIDRQNKLYVVIARSVVDLAKKGFNDPKTKGRLTIQYQEAIAHDLAEVATKIKMEKENAGKDLTEAQKQMAHYQSVIGDLFRQGTSILDIQCMTKDGDLLRVPDDKGLIKSGKIVIVVGSPADKSRLSAAMPNRTVLLASEVNPQTVDQANDVLLYADKNLQAAVKQQLAPYREFLVQLRATDPATPQEVFAQLLSLGRAAHVAANLYTLNPATDQAEMWSIIQAAGIRFTDAQSMAAAWQNLVTGSVEQQMQAASAFTFVDEQRQNEEHWTNAEKQRTIQKEK